MFSAGDNRYKLGLTPIQTAVVDSIAPEFCPVEKFGNDPVKKGDCDLLLAQVLADSTKDLPNDEAKDEFTAETFLPAAQTVGNQCQEQKTKKMVRDDRQCSLDSYKDEKKPKVKILTTRGGSILEMPFIPYLKAAAAGRVSGISGASIAGPTSTIVMLTRPVPTAKFSEFIKGLKDGGMTKLAYEAMRLFNDAVEREDFDPSKIDALVDSIMGAVQPYTEIVSAVEDEADKKSAINDAHDALSKTIIYKFEADGKGDFRTLPEEVWGAGKNLVERTGLRKLFTQAIPHYLKNANAPEYANSDANITKALKELGDAMLAAIAANDEKNPAKLVVQDVKAEDDGKPKEVIFADKAAAAKALVAAPKEDTDGRELPIRLILGLGAGWNDIALEALKELWRAAYLKNIKLAKLGTPEREKAIDSMIEQLGGASPVGIKSASVEKVDKNGTVVLKNLPEKKFADGYLMTLSGLEPDMYMAFYDKINELHREAVDSSEFKDNKFTEDDIAVAIEKSLKDAIGGGKAGGLNKFGLLHYAGLDKGKHPNFAAKGTDKGAFDGEATIGTYFDDGRAIVQGRLNVDIRLWEGHDWRVSLKGGLGYGERPGYFTRDVKRPTSNPQGEKDNSLLTGISLSADGKVMVGKEGEKFPLGISVEAGIVEDGNDFQNRIVFPRLTFSVPFGKEKESGSGSVKFGAVVGRYLNVNTNTETEDQWALGDSFLVGGLAAIEWLINKKWEATFGASLQYDQPLNGNAAKLLQANLSIGAHVPKTGLAGAFQMIYAGGFSETDWHYLSFRLPIEYMFQLPKGWVIGPKFLYRADLFDTSFEKPNNPEHTLDSTGDGNSVPTSIIIDPNNGKFMHIVNPQLCFGNKGTVAGGAFCMGYAYVEQGSYNQNFGTVAGKLTW